MSHPSTVADIAAFQAALRPDHPAVVCEGRQLTYGELHRESNRTAHAIRAAGFGPGARVGYLGKESERYYDIVFGCAKSGTVLVPINWRLTPAEVDHILRDSGAELLFAEPEFRATALELQRELPGLRTIVDLDTDWKAGHPDDDLAQVTGPEDPIAQLYTSGTTGLPKGVVLAQRSFFAIRDELDRAGLDWVDWRPGDMSLISIPGFHVAGIWWAMQGFTAGVTNVAMRMFNGADAVRLIREAKITTTLAVPAMLQMILAEPGVGPGDFASLRKVAYGGSPISGSLLRRSLEVLGCELLQMYGLTETGNVAVCLPPEDHVPGSPRLRAAGLPCPGVRIKVIDSTGAELPQGAEGEICLRTPAVMLEYWNLPEATAESLADGWFRTGDAGYLDADGYLYICDRLKDTIIVAGENVYPAEVENALCRHPAVLEAAVIGVPDERWGEAVQAFVVLRPGQRATPRELMLSVRSGLADFKVPTRYDFIERVPRNPSGKILRRTLREQFWSHLDRNVN